MYKKLLNFLLIGGVMFFVSSCQEEDQNEQENITETLLKIETIYQEGDVKIENDQSGVKTETTWDGDFDYEIEFQLAENNSKQNANAKTMSEDLVAVLSPTHDCHNFKMLVVYMDCEDSNSATSVGGAYNGIFNEYRNLRMTFCVVPNNFKRLKDKSYMILNLTSVVPADARRADRYFDNQDGSNNNFTTYDGGRIYGMGLSGFGSNTLLSFLHYEALSGSIYTGFPWLGDSPDMPGVYPSVNTGIEYSVFGTFYDDKGTAYSDDEDRNNRNSFNHYYRNSTNYTTGGISGIIDVGGNTRLYTSQAVYTGIRI